MIDGLKRKWASRRGDEDRFGVDIAPEALDVDAARDYDVDLAIFGYNIFGAALLLGIPLRKHGTRTARLTLAELDAMGFGDLHTELCGIAQHDVQFVIVQDERHARRLGLYIVAPPR